MSRTMTHEAEIELVPIPVSEQSGSRSFNSDNRKISSAQVTPVNISVFGDSQIQCPQVQQLVVDTTDGILVQPPALKHRTIVIILQQSTINFLISFTSGVVTIGLPSIATSISLERSLYLWPASVYSLATGATLLIAGSIADLIGARKVNLIGCLLTGLFSLVCGFANTGIQLVMFRALQGLAVSMHLPSSMGIVTAVVPAGKGRNIGFACLGMAQPLGFSFGLVLGGIMIQELGWRVPFYVSGSLTIAIAVSGFWALPTVNNREIQNVWRKLWTDIDWIGGSMSSASLAMLSYVLATLSADTASITHASSASLLAISLVLMLAFPFWMHFQKRRGKATLIPNSLWKMPLFTYTCIMVAISYGIMTSMELFISLYFQEIQHSTPLSASLRLLPSMIVGACLNIFVGVFLSKFPVRWLLAISSFLCAGAPLLMALTHPAWPFWYMEFPSQILAPLSVDVMFTVGMVIVSEIFPEDTQALAGAVFNTVAQFGQSLIVSGLQVVSLGVEGHKAGNATAVGDAQDFSTDHMYSSDLLRGYRASFWSMFGCMVICGLIALGGLKKAGKVGLKRD